MLGSVKEREGKGGFPWTGLLALSIGDRTGRASSHRLLVNSARGITGQAGSECKRNSVFGGTERVRCDWRFDSGEGGRGTISVCW